MDKVFQSNPGGTALISAQRTEHGVRVVSIFWFRPGAMPTLRSASSDGC